MHEINSCESINHNILHTCMHSTLGNRMEWTENCSFAINILFAVGTFCSPSDNVNIEMQYNTCLIMYGS